MIAPIAHSTLPPAERLRDPSEVARPDPRITLPPEGEAASLATQHAAVAELLLHAAVPEKLAIQFETAKNLYLYAWHVYRFYPVAEMQALATLEFGLREALPLPLPSRYWSNAQRDPPLSKLLQFACDTGRIRNEGFSRWHRAAEHRARERQSRARLQQMEEQGLTELAWDEREPVAVIPEDQDWDLIGVLRDSVPAHRNGLAHGGSYLRAQVRGTLELVGEMLNQLFNPPDQP